MPKNNVLNETFDQHSSPKAHRHIIHNNLDGGLCNPNVPDLRTNIIYVGLWNFGTVIRCSVQTNSHQQTM